MKSRKAKDKLDYNQCHVCDGILGDGLRVGCDDLVYYDAANEAIEIAEQEMMDKSVEAHIDSCPKLAAGNFCRNNKYYEKMNKCDGNCDYVKRFKEYMK